MEETEPAISDHSPERTEGGKDKPNEKEAENGGQEKEEEGNENEEDKTDTNKDGDQEEEEEEDNGEEEEEEGDANENGDQQREEEDGDQEEEEEDEGENELEEEGEDEADTNKDGDQEEEEEADEGPLEASSTPKKRKETGSRRCRNAPSKKRRKNNTSHQQKEEEDPAEILNVWKRKLVPGLPAAKPIHWCHGKKSHAKSGKRGEHRGGRKLGQLHHDKKYDREGSFRTGACSGGCLSSESTQRDLGKMGCSPSEGKHERVVCLQIAGPLQHLGPVSTLPILVHPCFKDDSVQRENPSPSPERPCSGGILASR